MDSDAPFVVDASQDELLASAGVSQHEPAGVIDEILHRSASSSSLSPDTPQAQGPTSLAPGGAV
eukprot:1032978-Prymnesium_polylepis.2